MRNHWDRSERDDSRMGVVMLVALLGGLLVGGIVAWQIGLDGRTQLPSIDVMGARVESRPPTRALSGATSAAPAATVASQATNSPPAAKPTTRPVEDSAEAHIANTDGEGVVLRASPRDNDWTPRGFMDGDAVTVLERQGNDWARVRGPNGQEGWVPARYVSR
jgi:hypothetical protein